MEKFIILIYMAVASFIWVGSYQPEPTFWGTVKFGAGWFASLVLGGVFGVLSCFFLEWINQYFRGE